VCNEVRHIDEQLIVDGRQVSVKHISGHQVTLKIKGLCV